MGTPLFLCVCFRLSVHADLSSVCSRLHRYELPRRGSFDPRLDSSSGSLPEMYNP